MIRLPKQWRHWCADQHLKPQSTRRGSRDWLYLVGRGHHWRVNSDNVLQIGDSYAEFDRWALCDLIELPIPQTRQQFREAVKRLILEKKKP